MKCRIKIKATVTWRDGDNVADTRPATVDLNLLRDGVVYETTTMDTAGDSTHSFSCLPAWKNSKHKYVYSIDLADTPDGYTKVVSGLNIINTVEAGSIDIDGTKTWDDGSSPSRPAQITVNLLQNGIQLQSTQVDDPAPSGDVATFRFSGVPQFNNEGVPFVYEVDEEDIPGYTKNVVGYDITNTL